jgi:glyoxylase-like metal-dependent hydrolase (beta-lactamase superfamily II)
MRHRHDRNAPGLWHVDTACIDCGAARTVAPGLIVRGGGQSVFARQPETAGELAMAWRARLLCPTASVHGEVRNKPPAGLFPEQMTPGVDRLGYNAKTSYGAHSFLVRCEGANAMVDAPRWTRPLVAAIEARGGLRDIFLTHRDDVADAKRYARHFGARVWIHMADSDAAPFATDILEGEGATGIDDVWLAIPVAGHTRGSVAYLYDGHCLFTGDSLAWSFDQEDLTAFRDVCWFSWAAQIRSLRRLLDYRFDWVLAGHGGSHHLPPDEMHRRLLRLLDRMERQ